MNLEAIENAIFDWVTSVVPEDVTIFWDEPEAPRPDDPSIGLSLISGPGSIGLDELLPVAGNPDAFRIKGPRTFLLSVDAYGKTAFQMLSDIVTSMSDDNAMWVLQKESVTVLKTSTPRDLSRRMETKYEKRAQMDFDLLATEDKIIIPGYVRSVSIAPNGGDIQGQTIEVDDDE